MNLNKMSNITAMHQRGVRESPFRETEWDRRLDDMLEDLENSAADCQCFTGNV